MELNTNPLYQIVFSITSIMPEGVAYLFRYLLFLWFAITLVGVLIGVISILRKTLGIR